MANELKASSCDPLIAGLGNCRDLLVVLELLTGYLSISKIKKMNRDWPLICRIVWPVKIMYK